MLGIQNLELLGNVMLMAALVAVGTWFWTFRKWAFTRFRKYRIALAEAAVELRERRR